MVTSFLLSAEKAAKLSSKEQNIFLAFVRHFFSERRQQNSTRFEEQFANCLRGDHYKNRKM